MSKETRGRVLVVEDEDTTRLMLERRLTWAGHRVRAAASADEAVVGEAALAAAPAASAAQEAAPQRLDPLSAVQDGQSPARGRGVSGLVSSVLRRRRR